MQAFTRRLGHLGELFEPDGGVDQVAENEAGRIRLTAQKQRCRFIEKRLGKLRIARNALNDGLLEVASQCHVITGFLCSLWPTLFSYPCIPRAIPWPDRCPSAGGAKVFLYLELHR